MNILFLCTGNSARSILAEAILRQRGGERFQAFSAGSHPTGQVNPLALAVLGEENIPTDGLHSKNWEVFSAAGAPVMDWILTVCDQAADEVCPLWPGQPASAHWGLPDPAAVGGSRRTRHQAFVTAFAILEHRIGLLLGQDWKALDQATQRRHLAAIGGAMPDDMPASARG